MNALGVVAHRLARAQYLPDIMGIRPLAGFFQRVKFGRGIGVGTALRHDRVYLQKILRPYRIISAPCKQDEIMEVYQQYRTKKQRFVL